MMDTVRKFSDYVRMQIQEYLPEQYQRADGHIKEILENNGVCKGATTFGRTGEKKRAAT